MSKEQLPHKVLQEQLDMSDRAIWPLSGGNVNSREQESAAATSSILDRRGGNRSAGAAVLGT
jgi:hypothetical protein